MQDDSRSDSDLIGQWATTRNEAAFEALVRRYTAFVIHVARQVCGNEAMAAEVCQLTFITLARRALTLRSRSTLAGWLHGTAVRHSRNLLRSRRRDDRKNETYHQQMEIHAATAPGEHSPELAVHLAAALAQLSASDRETILLRYYHTLSLEEIAERLGIAAAAARKRLQRAQERLRSRLRSPQELTPHELSLLLAGGFSSKSSVAAISSTSAIAAKAIAASASPPSLLTTILMTTSAKTATIAAAVILIGTGIYFTTREHSDDGPPDATRPTAATSRAPSESSADVGRKSSPPRQNPEVDAKLKELVANYSEARVRLARHITADALEYADHVHQLVELQRDAPPRSGPGAATLSDLALEFMRDAPAEKLAAARKVFAAHQQRTMDAIAAETAQLKQNPLAVSELLLVADSFWKGNITLEEYQKQVNRLGINDRGVLSPWALNERIQGANNDETYIHELRALFTAQELEEYSVPSYGPAEDRPISHLSPVQGGQMSLEALGNVIERAGKDAVRDYDLKLEQKKYQE